MRRLFQRRRTGACRRHTVANIVPPAGSVPGERRSSEDDAGRKTRDNRCPEPYQYQYVRQWSVDVAALADQLENPKAHLRASGATLTSRQQVCHASTETNAGKGAMPGDDVVTRLSVRENSALSGSCRSAESRDSPFASSHDSIHRSASDNDRMLRPGTGATGSDVISFDAPLRTLPEVDDQPRHSRPDLELSGANEQHEVRQIYARRRPAYARRTIVALGLFSVFVFIHLLLTALTETVTCQRTGALALSILSTWLLPLALVWISGVHTVLRCVCHCHVTCENPSA